ncbi:MAG: transporter permease, partial [Gemmataceae bacterium]|nr:transporter permease [Gemmataceae bacterium]
IEVPAGLFKNAAQGNPGAAPRLSVYVKCESGGQMLGMAEPDLFLLEGTQPFTVNFVKGMTGLWCRLCIVIGLAVACSTYLSGVLSLLVTWLIYLLGYFTEHLNDLAMNRNVGGGPFESMSRLVKTETPTAQLTDSAGTKVVQGLDHGWAWVVRRIQNVIPDVESFTWTHFVSEGFNINAEYLVINLLVTAGYLLPWAVLAYYLMKSREVAS